MVKAKHGELQKELKDLVASNVDLFLYSQTIKYGERFEYNGSMYFLDKRLSTRNNNNGETFELFLPTKL